MAGHQVGTFIFISPKITDTRRPKSAALDIAAKWRILKWLVSNPLIAKRDLKLKTKFSRHYKFEGESWYLFLPDLEGDFFGHNSKDPFYLQKDYLSTSVVNLQKSQTTSLKWGRVT